MTQARLFMCMVASAGVLAACAGPAPEEVEASLKALTASAMEGADAGEIEILNPERQGAKWVWQARVDGKPYACDADDQMRLPACHKLDQGA